MSNTIPATQNTTKYHMSTRTNKPEKCNATVRRCRYGGDDQHFTVENPKQAQLKALIDRTLVKKLPPVDAPKPPFYPTVALNLVDVNKVTEEENAVLNSTLAADSVIWFSTDAFTGELVANGFSENQIRPFLASFYGENPENIPDELVDYAKNELDILNQLQYTVYEERGYYESKSITSETNPEIHNALVKWYLEQPGAVDNDRVLPYARSKGVETVGTTPVDALKKTLLVEHPEYAKEDWFRKADSVTSKQVPLRNIVADKEKLVATPDGPVLENLLNAYENADSKFIAGVVVQVSPAKYKLVDGYQRFKALKKEKDLNAGEYIVLTSPLQGSKRK